MIVYTRIAGKLSTFQVDDVEDHAEAINMVVEALHTQLSTAELLKATPVLALIIGGKS